MIPNMPLEFAWARSRLVHMCSWHSHVNALNTNFGSPCNTCTVTVEILVMNVLTMPPHLGPLDLPQTITLPHAGFIRTLTHPCVLMAATTLTNSWNDCNTLDPVQRRFPKMGVSVVFTIGFIVFIVHLTRTFYLSSVILLSAIFLHLGPLISRTGHGKLFLICLYRAEF